MSKSRDDNFLKLINECLQKENKQQELPITLEGLKNNKELVELCIDVIVDNFCEYGLKEDSEPNEYGILLEDTKGFLLRILYSMENKDNKK